MDAGFSASCYWGGERGVASSAVLYMRTRWWNDRLRGKNGKRYGLKGRGWAFVGITGPIEAGFYKEAN